MRAHRHPSAESSSRAVVLGLVLALCLMAVCAAGRAEAATYTVTSSNDSGTGSLRAALLAANASTGVSDVISIADNITTISLSGGVLEVTDAVTITRPAGALTTVHRISGAAGIIDVGNSAVATIERLGLDGGSSSGGGSGLVVHNSASVTVRQSRVTNNSSGGNGGAIFVTGASMTLESSEVTGNTSTGGPAGIAVSSSPVAIRNSTIAGNTALAVDDVGGIQVVGAQPATIDSSTIARNTGGPNPGVAGNLAATFNGTVTLRNSIVAEAIGNPINCMTDPPGPSNNGTIVSSGFNVADDATCSLNQSSDLANADPLLGSLASSGGLTQTLVPGAASPAIDHGRAPVGVAVDQRGVSRPVDLPGTANVAGGDGSDSGAVETGAPLVTTLADAGPGSLRTAMNDAAILPGPDTITFAPGLAGTLNLASALPVVTSEVRVAGPGADQVTVRRDSGGDYRVFAVAGAGGFLTLEGLTVTNGKATSGGGVLNQGAFLTLRRVAVTGNAATSFGGGIASEGANPQTTILQSLINANTGGSASSGGGVEADAGQTVIRGSTITGNATPSQGGGGVVAWGTGTSVVVANSTIADNTSPANGGANVAVLNSAGLALSSTLVARPQGGAPNCYRGATGTFTSGGFNLLDGPAVCGTAQSSDLVGLDPQLGALAANGGPTQTMLIAPSSPAVDAGQVGGGLLLDQRGVTRPVDLAVANAAGGDGADIGAVELPDADGDGLTDAVDNCPGSANVGQSDRDGDGQGDACDATPDGDPVVTPTPVPTPTPGGGTTTADADGDGVRDAVDRCRSKFGPAPSGCPGVRRSAKLSYSKRTRRISGRLTAGTTAACAAKQPVTIYRDVKGPDKRITTVRTTSSGRWSKRKRLSKGRYYAKVGVRVISDVASCGAATSKRVRVR